MTDERYSTASARNAAADDRLGTWVRKFLASPGSDNPALGKMLDEEMGCWIGPVEIPLHKLHRLAGPPGAPVLTEVDEDAWRDDVADLADQVEDGLEPPPVIATWRQDHLRLEDGNHRVEAIRRTGAVQAWTVIGFADRADQDRFLAQLAAGESS